MLARSLFLRRIAVVTLLAATALPGHALASAKTIRDAIVETTQNEILESQRSTKASVEAMANAITGDGGLTASLLTINSERFREQITPAPVWELFKATAALPESIALTDQTVQSLMITRLREMQRIPYTAAEKPDYLIDTDSPDTVDQQKFDIFMRYFCDPQSRGGTLSSKTFELKQFRIPNGANYTQQTYSVGCGYASNSLPSRRSILTGTSSDTGVEARQIMSLPTRPEALFFEPVSFPTAIGNSAPNAASANLPSNINRIAPAAYLGAFAQSLQFLVGDAPAPDQVGANADFQPGDYGSFIKGQKEVAVKMLASYPFALLFAERTGTMGPQAAQSVALLLRTKIGEATQNPAILAQIDALKKRQSLSMAEYMNIVAYQLPTSPGYLTRVNELTPSQLKREMVWLTAVQTALNYQRNRWLEILAALEAVGRS